MKAKKYQQGFSLIEILIAMTILAMFAGAYFFGTANNVNDSMNMREELILAKLCELKINELILMPPKLALSSTLTTDKKKFDEEFGGAYKDYEYEIEVKDLSLPSLNKLNNLLGEEEASKSSALQKKIFEVMKKNIETAIWKIKVTVQKKGGGLS